MPVSVDVSQFSANSPLDYADLNKLVTAIQVVAAAIPTVVSPAPNTPGSPLPTGPTTIADHINGLAGTEITKTNNTGKQHFVTFLRNGKQVTFASKPLVVAMGSHSSGKGIAIVNVVSTTTTGFTVQVGWVGKASGNIGLKYIAVGTEIGASESAEEQNQANPFANDSYLDRRTGGFTFQ
jgi:hypothetical protein